MKEATRYPEIPYRSLMVSSYDRSSYLPDSAGWYANNDSTGIIRTEIKEGRTEKILFDGDGPGVITRIWIATSNPKGTCRFYFDGSPTANWEFSAYDLSLLDIEGIGDSFLRTHANSSSEKKSGGTFYLPIPYEKKCKITFEEELSTDTIARYYQINYRQYPEGTIVETLTKKGAKRLTKKITETDNLLRNPKANNDTLHISKRQHLLAGIPLRVELPLGNHCVNELTIKIKTEDPEDYAQAMRNIVLQAVFDGKQTVRVPVSDFSGGGMGAPFVQSWFLSADGNGHFTSRWPMPYQETAYIALVNQGNIAADIDLSVRLSPQKWESNTLYFHASWKQGRGLELSNDPNDYKKNTSWDVATIRGKGVYKGDVLTLYNHTSDWFGEGDEKIWVDNEPFPSHYGTGTGDYYNTSWPPIAVFQTPFGGAPRADNPSSFGYNTFFRTRNLDGIPFTDSLKIELELLGQKKGKIDYASTIFWYGDIKARSLRLSSIEEVTWKLPEKEKEPERPQSVRHEVLASEEPATNSSTEEEIKPSEEEEEEESPPTLSEEENKE